MMKNSLNLMKKGYESSNLKERVGINKTCHNYSSGMGALSKKS